MGKHVTVFTLMLFLFCSDVSFASDEEWRLFVDKKDVKVYARPIPDSSLKEYRAETVLDENIMTVSAVLDDISGAVDWIPFCMIAREVEVMADGRRLVLNVSDFPWPFKDRYSVFSFGKSTDASLKQVKIDFEADDFSNAWPVNDYAKVNDMVQVTFVKGEWLLLMNDEGKTKVTYTICADAGGKVPLWLVKTFFEGTPYQTLNSLRRFLKKSANQASPVPNQEEQELGKY